MLSKFTFTMKKMFCLCCSLFCLIALAGCGAERHRGEFLQELREVQKQFAQKTDNPRLRFQFAQKLFEAGDFAQARELLIPLVNSEKTSPEVLLLLAQVEYLHGNYKRAEELVQICVEQAEGNVWAGLEPKVYLAYIYYQTDQYAKSANLFRGMEKVFKKVGDDLDEVLALWELMQAFGQEPPYQIVWNGSAKTDLPFLQTEEYKLPLVEVEINGNPVQAALDSGGDMFMITPELASSLGIETIATSVGIFAGGKTAETGFARADSLKLGDVMIRNVPIEIGLHERCILGTGILRHFLATLDYPNNRLILRPKSKEGQRALHEGLTGKTVTEVPFVLMATHLMFVQGRLNEQDHLIFLVDSGLEDTGGAAFTAPVQTLQYANISISKTTTIEGDSGAGNVKLELGYFPIKQLGLGTMIHENVKGMYGAFPPQLYHDMLGFFVDGLISHNYLRHYAWSIDFSVMKVILAQ